MWSSKNSVTLFGADATKHGAEEVRRFFHLVASWFANCTAYRFDLVAAEVSGDLGNDGGDRAANSQTRRGVSRGGENRAWRCTRTSSTRSTASGRRAARAA